MKKHTPGPWKVDPKYPDSVVTDNNKRQKDIASALAPGYSDSGTRTAMYPTISANAQLIAPAPEMLAILKKLASYELLREHEGSPQGKAGARRVRDQALQIINKAEGR